MSTNPPETIRFNAIDRFFLIPETEDLEGAYFPMLICGGVELNQPLEREQIVAALHRVNARFPEFRLDYQLDYKTDSWRKVTDLEAHFQQITRIGETSCLEKAVADGVQTNIVPFSTPLQATTYGHLFTLRAHHALLDGVIGMKLLAHVLIAALDPEAYERIPDPPARHYQFPMWRLVWSTPRLGMKTLWNWARTFKSSLEDFKGDGSTYDYTPEPVRNGTPMALSRLIIPREMMRALGRARRTLSAETPITLNTLMQVMIGHRLVDLGFLPIEKAITYMQVADLRRYRKDSLLYSGNLVGQVRVRIIPHDLSTDCIQFQTRLEADLKSGMPLATLPSEWLFYALAGKRRYKKINRNWLMEGIHTDPQFFTFSNLGILDSDYRLALPYIQPNTNLALSGSLIGAPPLRILFGVLAGEGHMGFTYNPRVLNSDQIDQIAEAFTPQWLEERLDRVKA